MRNVLLSLALLAPVAAVAAPPPASFSADYQVFQDGTLLGTGSIELRPLPGGQVELRTRSRATEGMAAMAGITREERSLLDWNGGRAETLDYTMKQKAAWNERSQRLQVDASGRRATSTYKDQVVQLDYRPGLVDKHAVTALLMSELAAGRRGEMVFGVAERRVVEDQRYRTAANVVLQTALGPQRAVRVERVRNDGSGRVTKIWFARERGWIPLRIKQIEADGESLDMRITAIR